jgi:hypothetical protein
LIYALPLLMFGKRASLDGSAPTLRAARAFD